MKFAVFRRLAQAARAYPFRRFLAQKWWTCLFLLAKARLGTRDGYTSSYVMFGIVAVILVGWYLLVLVGMQGEVAKR